MHPHNKVNAIIMVAMFIIFPWSYISPVGNIAFDDSDFYDGVEQESWESEWIESEPSYVSSENGRGFSTTIEWLSVQHLSLIHI